MDNKEDDLERLHREFILDSDAEHEDLQELIRDFMQIARIDKQGHPIIDGALRKRLTKADHIQVVCVVKHLANRLQKKLGVEVTVTEEIDPSEIARIVQEQLPVVHARMKELKDTKQLVQEQRGVYRVAAHSVRPFVDKLRGKYLDR